MTCAQPDARIAVVRSCWCNSRRINRIRRLQFSKSLQSNLHNEQYNAGRSTRRTKLNACAYSRCEHFGRLLFVADEDVMNAVAPKSRKLYNLEQMTAIDGPDGKVRHRLFRPTGSSLLCLCGCGLRPLPRSHISEGVFWRPPHCLIVCAVFGHRSRRARRKPIPCTGGWQSLDG